MKGSKYLFVTGLLEIVIGAVSIGLITWILGQNPADFNIIGVNVAETLWLLVLIYAIAGFQILSGLLGVILHKSAKAAKFLSVIGIILILIQSSSFAHADFDVMAIIVNTIFLIAPVYYFYGAMLNKKITK